MMRHPNPEGVRYRAFVCVKGRRLRVRMPYGRKAVQVQVHGYTGRLLLVEAESDSGSQAAARWQNLKFSKCKPKEHTRSGWYRVKYYNKEKRMLRVQRRLE